MKFWTGQYINYLISFVIVIVIMVVLLHSLRASGLYGTTPPYRYVSGKFDPSRHEKFVSLSEFNIPTNKRVHYLRIETVLALQQMYNEFKKEHPCISFRLISTTRNYYTQRSIWMAKWNGKRLVQGKRLNRTIRDPEKRALKILEYSSMPGTSRHHWGTDFDINSLSNKYFESGKGKLLYQWLVKNAHKYGFCQPYTANRSSGYQEEKWHWSYIPIAKKMLKDWNSLYQKDNSFVYADNPIPAANKIYRYAPIYVNMINDACK